MYRAVLLGFLFFSFLLATSDTVRAIPARMVIERAQIETVDDFFPFLDRNYSAILTKDIPEMSRYFLSRFSPSIADANEFIRKFPQMTPTTYSEIKKYEFSKIQSIGDFFDAADSVIEQTAYNVTLQGIIHQHFPSFIVLKPTLADVNGLFSMYPGLANCSAYQIKEYIREEVVALQSVEAFFAFLKREGIPDRQLRQPITEHFIRLSPTLAEVNRYVRRYGDDDYELLKYVLEKKMLQTTDEYFAFVEYKIPKGGNAKRTIEKLISEYMHVFYDLHPTEEDISKLTGIFPGLSGSVFFQARLEQIHTVEEVFTMFDQFRQIPASHWTYIINKFIRFDPTIEQINECISRLKSLPMREAIRLKRDGLKRGLATDVPRMFMLINGEVPSETKEYKDAIGALITEHTQEFLNLQPTLVEVDQLIELLSLKEYGQIKNVMEPYIFTQIEFILEHIHHVEEYAVVIKRKFQTRDMRNGVLGFVDRAVNHFLEQCGTVQEINEFMDRYNQCLTLDHALKIQKVILERGIPKNVGEYFTILDLILMPYLQSEQYTAFWKKQDDVIRSTMSSTVDRFIQFSPTLEQINEFIGSYGRALPTSALLALKRDGLERRLPKTANEYITLINPGIANPHAEYKKGLVQLISEHADFLEHLHPTVEEVRDLITTYPVLVESFAYLTLPAGLGPLCERMHQIQNGAFEKMQRMSVEWREKLKKQSNGKRSFLKDSIDRNIAFCKNGIGEEVQRMTREVQNITNWEETRKANWERLDQLEKVLHQFVKKVEGEIKQDFTKSSYPKLKGRRLTTSKDLLEVVREERVNQFILGHNRGVGSTSTEPATTTVSSQCLICEEELTDEERVAMDPCHHHVCKACLGSHIRVRLEDGEGPIRCVADGCTTLLEEKNVVQAGIEGDELRRWRKHTLRRMPSVISCPRDDCDALLLNRDKPKQDVLCGKCYKSICPKCEKAAHPGVKCKETDRIEQFLEGESGFEQLMKADIVQRCPHCQAPTIRTRACLHIDCTRCKKRWNYRGDYRSDNDKSII